jgi:hypothetical protein
MTRPARLAAVTLGLALAAPAHGASGAIRIEHATFAATAVAGETPLRLRGAGLLRWGFFVKVYAAALYVADEGGFDPHADTARRLEFTYFVGFSADDLRGAADHVLRQNFTSEVLAPLRGRIDALHEAYVNVRSGDRVTITYVPGRGTELTLNGKSLAVVEGADFARAYFAIFLGERPVDEGLRRALLGN